MPYAKDTHLKQTLAVIIVFMQVNNLSIWKIISIYLKNIMKQRAIDSWKLKTIIYPILFTDIA